jgi:hypothetical protein
MNMHEIAPFKARFESLKDNENNKDKLLEVSTPRFLLSPSTVPSCSFLLVMKRRSRSTLFHSPPSGPITRSYLFYLLLSLLSLLSLLQGVSGPLNRH